jgi:hypothetical protein
MKHFVFFLLALAPLSSFATFLKGTEEMTRPPAWLTQLDLPVYWQKSYKSRSVERVKKGKDLKGPLSTLKVTVYKPKEGFDFVLCANDSTTYYLKNFALTPSFVRFLSLMDPSEALFKKLVGLLIFKNALEIFQTRNFHQKVPNMALIEEAFLKDFCFKIDLEDNNEHNIFHLINEKLIKLVTDHIEFLMQNLEPIIKDCDQMVLSLKNLSVEVSNIVENSLSKGCRAGFCVPWLSRIEKDTYDGMIFSNYPFIIKDINETEEWLKEFLIPLLESLRTANL